MTMYRGVDRHTHLSKIPWQKWKNKVAEKCNKNTKLLIFERCISSVLNPSLNAQKMISRVHLCSSFAGLCPGPTGDPCGPRTPAKNEYNDIKLGYAPDV